MSTRGPLSVRNRSPLGSKAIPAGELKVHGLTVPSQGDREIAVPPAPLSGTWTIWLVVEGEAEVPPSATYRLAPALSTANPCGKITVAPRLSKLGVYDAKVSPGIIMTRPVVPASAMYMLPPKSFSAASGSVRVKLPVPSCVAALAGLKLITFAALASVTTRLPKASNVRSLG